MGPVSHMSSFPSSIWRSSRLLQLLALVAAASLLAVLPAAVASADNAWSGSANRPQNDGYWLVAPGGAVQARGNAPFLGSMADGHLNKPIVGMASTPSGNGYWLVASDGGIFSYGDAQFFGSTGSIKLNRPIVAMAGTPSGHGYWLVASDGGVFSYGDAQFFGSTGSIALNKPIVGMASTPSGNGYWLVASDGGVFSYGDAQFFGSTGSIALNQPIVAMSASLSGHGYWMVGADGGIFSYGDAQFYGSTPSSDPAIAVVRLGSGGYTVVRADGSVDTNAPLVTPTADSSGNAGDAGTTTTTTLTPAGPTTSTTAPTTPPTPTPTTVPPTTSTPVPVASGNGPSTAGWTLASDEEFNAASLNTSVWGTYYGAGNEGVGLRRPSAITEGNGEMDITASGNTGGGMCWCGSAAGGQTYGRYEIRAKMDTGTGYGPAILLWPSTGSWPTAGEIDITEMPEGARNLSHFTLHYGADNSQMGHTESGDFSQWHTYTVDWEADHITFYLDGTAVYTNTSPAAIPHGPMHLAIQNDVGAAGHWIPGPDATTPAQVALHVDYVRIYR